MKFLLVYKEPVLFKLNYQKMFFFLSLNNFLQPSKRQSICMGCVILIQEHSLPSKPTSLISWGLMATSLTFIFHMHSNQQAPSSAFHHQGEAVWGFPPVLQEVPVEHRSAPSGQWHQSKQSEPNMLSEANAVICLDSNLMVSVWYIV